MAQTTNAQVPAGDPRPIPNVPRDVKGNPRVLTDLRPVPGTSRPGTMKNFRVHWPETTGQDLARGLNIDYGELVQLEFWRPDSSKDAPVVFSACLREILNSSDPKVITGFYASAVCCFMPGVESEFEEALKDHGTEPDFLKMPSQGADVGAEFPLLADRTKCLIEWAQLIMLLFKNVTAINYTRYMTAMINALKAHVGYLGEDPNLIALDLVKASKVKTAFGNVQSLRKEVLATLLRGRNLSGLVGAVCSYLCGILSWTDMGGIMMIFEAFCITNSPVLKDERVVNEVRALADAFQMINQHTLPQYFRIQASPWQQKFLERANFSTLLGVAQKVRGEVHQSIKNLVVYSTATKVTINDLHSIHQYASERRRCTRALTTGSRQDRASISQTLQR